MHGINIQHQLSYQRPTRGYQNCYPTKILVLWWVCQGEGQALHST